MAPRSAVPTGHLGPDSTVACADAVSAALAIALVICLGGASKLRLRQNRTRTHRRSTLRGKHPRLACREHADCELAGRATSVPQEPGTRGRHSDGAPPVFHSDRSSRYQSILIPFETLNPRPVQVEFGSR
jgi:hypothetical protein